MVSTIKFSQMTDGGDIENNDRTPGLKSGGNVLFNNPWTFLPDGTTDDRPAPSSEMYWRIRFNLTIESYEYYSPVEDDWIQLEDSLDIQDLSFIVYKNEPLLPNSFSLGTLSSGILKQTVISSVATPEIAVNAVDYWAPGDALTRTQAPTVGDDVTNKTYVDSLVAGSVTSATGTANQVLINGTSGVSQTGALTFTLPQDINTTSSPTFLALTAGNLNLSSSTLSSLSSNSNISLIPNGMGKVLVGSTTPIFAASGQMSLNVAQGGKQGFINAGAYVNSSSGPQLSLVKSRSTTVGSFVAVQNGDVLSNINFYGDDGTSLGSAKSQILCTVSGSVSTGIVPTQLTFLTTNTSGSLLTAMTISNAQIVTLANALPVGSGGLGITSTPSNGQIPIGNGSTYTANTITAGTNISVTNGSGTITISATGSASFSWASIAGTSQSAVVQTGYIPTNAGLTTITLPTTFSVGDRISVQGQGSGGWRITAGASTTVQVGSSATSSGGTISSANRYDSINLIAIVSNTTWATLGGPQSAGLTIA